MSGINIKNSTGDIKQIVCAEPSPSAAYPNNICVLSPLIIMKKFIALLALASIAHGVAAAGLVGNPKAAEGKIAMCIGCHGIPGYRTAFPDVYQVPMIGGQSQKYLENALIQYRKGERKHPSMRGIAGSLSDQDIADLAAYYAQQK